ncbi:MAG: glycerophosphodiester phosphodiesterase [Promethearchaeota archaeon]
MYGLEKIPKKNKIYVTAHRGANAECPENTILSFEKAVEIGADLIEMDIHLSKDEAIVVMHDANTRRVADIALSIKDSTYEQLQEANLPEGQKIPLLDEVFEKFRGKVGFVIEIKATNLAEALLNKIKEYDVSESCIIISFRHNELVRFRELNKDIPIATLEPSGGRFVSGWLFKKNILNHVKSLGFEGVHPFHKLLNKKFVESAHKMGIFVNPWTVDDNKRMEQLIGFGVDGITTNDPRTLISILQNSS